MSQSEESIRAYSDNAKIRHALFNVEQITIYTEYIYFISYQKQKGTLYPKYIIYDNHQIKLKGHLKVKIGRTDHLSQVKKLYGAKN